MRIAKTTVVFVSVFLLVLLCYIDKVEYQKSVQIDNSSLADYNNSIASRLTEKINIRLQLTRALAAVVNVDPSFAMENFDSISIKLIGDLNGIISLQLAPDGIVTYVTDLSRNESAIGHDLLAGNRKRKLAEVSANDRVLTVEGPISLIQGGNAIIARMPIFVNGGDSFWGFSTVLLDVNVLLQDLDSEMIDEQVVFALRKKEQLVGDREVKVLFGDRAVFDSPAALGLIILPHCDWEIAIQRKGEIPPDLLRWRFWLWGIGIPMLLAIPYIIFQLLHLRIIKEVEYIAKDLRNFIETANATIFAIDTKGLLNEWNHSSEKVTGFIKEDVLGKKLAKNYFSEDSREQVNFILGRALLGKNTSNFQIPMLRVDGKSVIMMINFSPRRNIIGEIIGVICVGQDVTAIARYKDVLELKVRERTNELEHALNREKEQGLLKTRFVSMASHQFRTPLTVIRSNAELLEMLILSDKSAEPEKKLKITNRIVGAVANMTELTDSLLTLGKYSEKVTNYSPKYVSIIECCNSLILQFNLIQNDGRVLDFEIEGKPFRLFLDYEMLTQALSNLICNAFKYSQGSKNPKLKLFFDENYLRLSLKDYGIGIPKDEIRYLSEPFFRANNAIGIKGTGLGLSIANKSIEFNRGELKIESKEGGGSTFEIIFKKEA